MLLPIFLIVLYLILIYRIFRVPNVISAPKLSSSLPTDKTQEIFCKTYSTKAEPYCAKYQTIVPTSASFKIVPSNEDINKKLENIADTKFHHYTESYFVSAEFLEVNSTDVAIARYSMYQYQSPFYSLALLDNAVLKKFAPEYSIEVFSHPIVDKYFDPLSLFDLTMRFEIASNIISFILKFALILLAANFAAVPLRERMVKTKQLQLMTGVSPFLYWFSFLIWHLLLLALLTFVICLLLFFADSSHLFSGINEISVIAVFLFGFSFANVCFSYCVSFFVQTPGKIVLILFMLHYAIVVLGVKVLELVLSFSTVETQALVDKIFHVIPSYAFNSGIDKVIKVSKENNRCKGYPQSLLKQKCELIRTLGSGSDPCCITNPTKKDLLSDWFSKDDDKPEAALSLCVLFALGVIYFALILIYEYRYIFFKSIRTNKTAEDPLDEDVYNENKRVGSLITEGNTKSDLMVASDLSKVFGNREVVKHISFGVHYGECFGMLGVNGAGKTTTFNMITGEVLPTTGSAVVREIWLHTDRSNYMKKIGYCPQFDALVDCLTPYEMLYFFGTIKGISEPRLTENINKIVDMFDIKEHCNRACVKLSGGTKRKVSTSIALLGDPDILLLDEPSASIDPAARRKLWEVLLHAQKEGKAIILTSHSMDECEALCNRVAIMVSGKFRCLGSIQYLKSKFSSGYIVTLQFHDDANSEKREIIRDTVMSGIPSSFIKEEHVGTIEYAVPDVDLSWSFLFKTMEGFKKKHSEIKDYSVRGTTLEEVFLTFSRNPDFKGHTNWNRQPEPTESAANPEENQNNSGADLESDEDPNNTSSGKKAKSSKSRLSVTKKKSKTK